jgi:hypothetical protein
MGSPPNNICQADNTSVAGEYHSRLRIIRCGPLDVAKDRWAPADDVVLILAVRHQLEAGYKAE